MCFWKSEEAVLRVEYDYPEGEVEEIAYQETGDIVL
jgi:hypothetical protein